MKCKNIYFLIAVLSLTGCAETRKMVVECEFPSENAPQGPALVAQEYGRMSPIPLNAIQYVDRSLTEQLVIQSLRTSRTPTNTVKVSARIVNCGDSPLVVGVRTHFFDKDQASTEKETTWHNVVIQPHALGQYSESSLSPNVANYLLEMRDAR